MTAKEIRNQMSILQNQLRDIKKQEREEFKKTAVDNVGRCFIVGNKYVKIIDIPQEEYDMSGNCHFNQYQYPALYIGKDFRVNDNDIIPFYEDTLFSGTWGVGNNVLSKGYKEISPEEFNAEFDRVLSDFRKKICCD